MTDRFVHISGDVGAESIIVKQQRQEIAQLKEAIRRLADQGATLSVCDGNVTVTMDATLTAEERECLEWAELAAIVEAANETTTDQIPVWEKRAATLRKLLERTV